MDQTRIEDETLNDLCRQAEEAMRAGDPQAARQIYEAVLSIDPDEPRASAAIARFDADAGSGGWDLADLAPESPSPGPAVTPATTPPLAATTTAPLPLPPAGAPLLELDLDLSFPASPDPRPPADPRTTSDLPTPADLRDGDHLVIDGTFAPGTRSAPTSASDDQPQMRDLLDAANDLADEREVEAPEDALANQRLAGVDAGAGEAALLAARARGELEAGNTEDARQLAARALALSERCTTAQAVLDEINTRNDRAARESEQLLCEAGLELDRGRPDLAVPLLRQALVLAPGHPEIEEYLSRAEAACGADAGFRPAPPPPLRATVEPAVAGAVAQANPQPPSAPPLPRPSPGPPPAPPPPPPSGAGGTSHGNIAGPPIGSVSSIPVAAPSPSQGPPPASPAAPATARRPAHAARGRQKAGGAAPPAAGRLVRIAVLLLVLSGLGAAGWLMRGSIAGLFGLGGGDDEQAEQVVPVQRAKVKPAEAPPAPAPAAPAAPAAPVLTRADVPGLLAKAETKLAARDEKAAVDLLTTALALAPEDFAIAEKLQRARAALRVHEDADAKLREAKARFAQDDYEEGLRLLYRIPDPHKPANLKQWIANGWYNVGIQRLQTGDLAEAIQDFSNCLEERPDDEAARRHREVARRYRGRTLDDAYRIYVNGLALRRTEP